MNTVFDGNAGIAGVLFLFSLYFLTLWLKYSSNYSFFLLSIYDRHVSVSCKFFFVRVKIVLTA